MTTDEMKKRRKALRRKLSRLNNEAALNERAAERPFSQRAISLLRIQAEEYRQDAKETAGQVAELTTRIDAAVAT